MLQDEDIAKYSINSDLTYEQKLSLVKTILTDENFDNLTKNKIFSAILKNQEFLERFIDEHSVQELLLAWNFDNLNEDNLFLAFKQINSIQEEGMGRHTKLLSKIFKSILTSTNIEFHARISCLFSMLYKGKEISLDLIHEYFMNNELSSIEGLTDGDNINKLIELIVKSKLFDDEKKSSLITKFLSEKISDDESFDAEIKKNIFISLFRNEEFALKFIEEGNNIYYFAIYKQYLPEKYQVRFRFTRPSMEIVTQTETQISTSSNSQETQTDDSLASSFAIQTDTVSHQLPKTRVSRTKTPSADDFIELSSLLAGRILDLKRMVYSHDPDSQLIHQDLKQFNVNFFSTNVCGNLGLRENAHGLSGKFHLAFDPLFGQLLDRIHNKDLSFDKERLKTYLYAILCISAGEDESIDSLFYYRDHLIGGVPREQVRYGIGHGSWIQKPVHLSKLQEIIKKMDELASKEEDIFTETNLKKWLECQAQIRRTRDFKFRSNKEFISKLIKSFDVSANDQKFSEIGLIKDDLGDFLKPNAIFLQNLVKIVNQVDHENKGIADHLFEHLIAKITPLTDPSDQDFSVVFADKIEKILELKVNFADKITKFITQLSSNITSDFLDDPHHQLILELILEIPDNIEDILRPKLSQDFVEQGVNYRASDLSKKISKFIKSLEPQDSECQRQTIIQFRETCLEQSQIYSQKARELRELRSPAKTSSASASR